MESDIKGNIWTNTIPLLCVKHLEIKIAKSEYPFPYLINVINITTFRITNN